MNQSLRARWAKVCYQALRMHSVNLKSKSLPDLNADSNTHLRDSHTPGPSQDQVLLGLGTNQGNRLQSLRMAVSYIKAHESIELLGSSAIYESDALLPQGAPESWNLGFLNCVVLCKTSLDPIGLLREIKHIEAQLGRTQKGRWAPREIDIDILLWKGLMVNHEKLKVPHPGLADRPFALLPCLDLTKNPWTWIPDTQHSGPSHQLNHLLQKHAHQWRVAAPEDVPFRTRRSTHMLTMSMGILNVTPDSFSDGGRYVTKEAGLKHAQTLGALGCDILDIGAESTRPGAQTLDDTTEWQRLAPLLRPIHELPNRSDFCLSIDTRRAATARQAIQLGAEMINDVSACDDPKMLDVLAPSSCQIVLMHHLGVPPKSNITLNTHEDPVEQLLDWGEQKIRLLESAGIARHRIWIDPGVGFGKTPKQTWDLLRQIHRLHSLKVKLLVGHSRKSFLSSIDQTDQSDLDDSNRPALKAHQRDIETHAISSHLIANGVECLRIHDLEGFSRALRVQSQLTPVRYSGQCETQF